MLQDTVAREYDVFISYVHADGDHDVASALAIGNWLEDEGYDVWWDRHLLFGDVQNDLERKVRGAKRVIVLWSPRAAKSEWVARECEWAIKDDKLAPIIIEDEPLKPGWDRFFWLKLTNLEAQKDEIRRRLPPPSRKRGMSVAGLPTPARIFIGRGEELARLQLAWASTAAGADPALKTNVFMLHAIGGAGKSALLQEFLHLLDERQVSGAHTVYAWSAYSQGSGDNRVANADEFMVKALGFFGHDLASEPIKDPVDRARRLAHLVGEQRALVMLDGLEPLQDAPHIRGGRLRDRGLAEFIKCLARSNKGLLVITSRQELPELANAHPPRVISRALDRMSSADGMNLLVALGVHGKGADINSAVEEVLGHVLSLNLLGTYLDAVYGGNVRRRGPLKLDAVNELPADLVGDQTAHYAKRAALIIESAIARFGALNGQRSLGSEAELAILNMVGLFDRPAEKEALDQLLAEPVIPGLTDAFCDFSMQQKRMRWNVAVDRLRKLRLLSAQDPREPGNLDAHPIVRAYFQSKLRRLAPEAFRQAHGRLYDFYRYLRLPVEFRAPETYALLVFHVTQNNKYHLLEAALSKIERGDFPDDWRDVLPPTFFWAPIGRLREAIKLAGKPLFAEALVPFLPSNLDDMRSCFLAISHGCAAGRYQEAYEEVYSARLSQGTARFVSMKLGALSASLATLAPFFDQVWSSVASNLREKSKAQILSDTGFSLRALGRSRDAVEPYEASLKLPSSKQSSIDSGCVAELRLTLGDLVGAIEAARASKTLADAVNDISERMYERTNLADCLHQAGRIHEAIEQFREAEAVMAGHPLSNLRSLPRLFGVPGYRYRDLLLAQGRSEIVIEQGQKSLAWLQADANAPIITKSVEHLSLGRAYASLPNRSGNPVVRWGLKGSLALRSRSDGGKKFSDADEDVRRARLHLDAAVDGLRRASVDQFIVQGLLARAAFRRTVGEYQAAVTDLEEVNEIALNGEMRLHLTDYHLEYARLLLARLVPADASQSFQRASIWRAAFGRKPTAPPFSEAHAMHAQAEDHCAAAERLILETGYRRRLAELDALRAWLDGAVSANMLNPDRDRNGRPYG